MLHGRRTRHRAGPHFVKELECLTPAAGGAECMDTRTEAKAVGPIDLS